MDVVKGILYSLIFSHKKNPYSRATAIDTFFFYPKQWFYNNLMTQRYKMIINGLYS